MPLLRLGLLLAAALSLLPSRSLSQASSAPEITIEGSRADSVALEAFSGPSGAEARTILERSLAREGLLRLVPASPSVPTARAQATTDRLEGSLSAPGGQILLRQTYQGASLRQLVHRFSDDIVKALTGSSGIASSKLAFVSDRSGHKEVYLSDTGGGQVLQVTQDRSLCVSPSLSRDGRYLAYTSYAQGYADVFLTDLANARRLRIFAEPGTNTGAAISPNAQEIALTMSHPGNPELFVGPLTGGSARRLTTNPFVEASPSWSPDGKSLVFVSGSNQRPQLFIVSSRGGRPIALDTGYPECFEPAWSPDGKRIAFTYRKGGVHQIAIYDMERKASRPLTQGPGAEQPAWGPNSRHLIYLEGNTIFLHDTASGRREPVLNRFGTLSELAWNS